MYTLGHRKWPDAHIDFKLLAYSDRIVNTNDNNNYNKNYYFTSTYPSE